MVGVGLGPVSYTHLDVYKRQPKDPAWVGNLRANPDIEVMDGTVSVPMRARDVFGEERQLWWERGAAVFPDYTAYQARTTRVIPVFVLEPR